MPRSVKFEFKELSTLLNNAVLAAATSPAEFAVVPAFHVFMAVVKFALFPKAPTRICVPKSILSPAEVVMIGPVLAPLATMITLPARVVATPTQRTDKISLRNFIFGFLIGGLVSSYYFHFLRSVGRRDDPGGIRSDRNDNSGGTPNVQTGNWAKSGCIQEAVSATSP